jgi:hypothetical protein
MGIEYIIVNHDKEEILDFDRLGFGTKIGAITSQPITYFLSWLLINPEGFGDQPPPMIGRWAGDRIEIVGDEGEGYERQTRIRKQFTDIAVEAIKAFSDANPYERITEFQPMGLIDKDGNVVVDSKSREAVRKYWEEMEALDEIEFAKQMEEKEREQRKQVNNDDPRRPKQ